MDIGELTGSIALADGFSSVLEYAAQGVTKFTDQFEGEMTLVLGISAGVVAAIGAISAAIVELGEHGSEVNDISMSFDRLGGGVENASAILDAMHTASVGTISDMALMTDANKLLAMGAVTTADQFGTLTAASRTLSHEGFGDLPDLMDTVGRALETGRVRSLALMGVTVDTKAAEEAYAESLDTTSASLTKAQKLIADRQAIMAALATTVAQGGDQELNFKEKIEAGEAAVKNFVDQLAGAVAESPVLSTALTGIETALGQAFGGTQQTAIQTIMGYINEFVVLVLDVGIASVTAVTVGYAAWSMFKTGILEVELEFVNLAAGVMNAIASITATAAALPFASQGMKDMAASAKSAAAEGDAMVVSLQDQVIESAKGVTGTSDFNKTLDAMGGTLMNARDASIAATNATKDHTAATTAFTGPINQATEATASFVAAWKTLNGLGENYVATAAQVDTATRAEIEGYLDAGAQIQVLAKAYPQLSEAQITAIAKVQKANADEADSENKLWMQVFTAKGDLYVSDVQKATNAAEQKYEIAVQEAQKKGITDVGYYNALWALRQTDIDKAEVDTKALFDNSVQGMQAILDKAQANLDALSTDGLTHTAAQIQHFRDLRDAALDALHGISDATGTANTDTSSYNDTVMGITTSFEGWNEAVMALNDSLDATDEKEKKAIADAQKLRDMGSSFTYDLTTSAGVAQFRSMNTGMVISWSDDQLMDFAQQGGTLQQLMQMGVIHMKAFDEGGPTGMGGPAMLHESEYVVPKGGALVMSDKSPSTKSGDTHIYQISIPGLIGTVQQIVDGINAANVQRLGVKF